VIRRLATNADTGNAGGGYGVAYALPAEAGLNRALWDLRTAATVELNYGETVSESAVEVAWDPINDYDPARIAEQQQVVAEIFDMLDSIYRRLADLDDLRSQVEMRRKLAEAAGDEVLAESARALLDDLNAWRDRVSSPNVKAAQDQVGLPPKLEAFLANIYWIVDEAVLGLTRGQRDRIADLRPRWEEAIDDWDRLVGERVAELNDGAGPAMRVPDRSD